MKDASQGSLESAIDEMREIMGNVVKLELVEVGDGFRFDGDQILEAAKGRNWHRLVIVGQTEEDDELYVAGTANAGESLILMEKAKLQIING